jgi:integrase
MRRNEMPRQRFLDFWRAFRPTVPRRKFAMRDPKPWYRKSTDAWYAQVDRRQIRLANGRDNRNEAKRKLAEIIAGIQPVKPDTLTAAQVCDKFLGFSKAEHKAETYSGYLYYLQKFCDRNGKLPTSSLIPHHITQWLAENPSWKGSKRHARGAVKGAFAWAVREGLVSKNPFAEVVVGKSGRRDRILKKTECEEILGAIKDSSFREFVFAMMETGCRPSEVARVTAADVDLALGVWVLKKHKTSKKTGRERVVYLTPGMFDLSRVLIDRHPTGVLFRGRFGQPLTNQAIRLRFRNLRRKLPHLVHFSAYTYRHTYCTEALVNGVGIAHVAELMGHSSTEMVSRVYSKLSQQVAHMREAAAKATG